MAESQLEQNDRRFIGRVALGAAMALAVLAAACGGHDAPTSAPTSGSTSDPVPVVSVVISVLASPVYVGSVIQLEAAARNASGQTVTGRPVTWASSNTAIATVSPSGVVRGAAAGGPVTITATVDQVPGSASVSVLPLPATMIVTGIQNPDALANVCPTSDPIYSTLRQDFAFLSDGAPSTVAIACVDPWGTFPIAQMTDELLALQTLRLAYYMNAGSAGKLPWTSLGLYDWIKVSIAGVNFRTQPGLSACCDVIGGRRYMITSRKPSFAGYSDWNGLYNWLGLFLHEARHATGPGHVNGCPALPLPTDSFGCDATYNLSNLGSYGVQYWYFAGIASGQFNVGIGCMPAATAQARATAAATQANLYPNRFVTNAPPSVTAATPFGGVCFTP